LAPRALPGSSTDEDRDALVSHGAHGSQVDHQIVGSSFKAPHHRRAELTRAVVGCDDEGERRLA
jgi:hypothetical protein